MAMNQAKSQKQVSRSGSNLGETSKARGTGRTKSKSPSKTSASSSGRKGAKHSSGSAQRAG
jgi:hypothetical protein